MNKLALPLLSGNDRSTFPRDGNCPACGTSFKESGGFAYLCAGALWVDERIDSSFGPGRAHFHPESFCHLGFHGSDREDRDHVNVDVVDTLNDDQFELNFCSLTCLRRWLNQVLDDLQRELDEKKSRIGRSGDGT